MKFLKENKNYIKAVALALVILMCTPFITLNAIETMSGGRSMEVTTGATTTGTYQFKDLDAAYSYFFDTTDVTSAEYSRNYNAITAQGSNYTLYMHVTGTYGYIYINNTKYNVQIVNY